MPLTSRKPDTLEAVLDLVRQAVDTAHASALRTMARTSSGVPQARTLAAQGQAKAAYDALLQLLEDIDPRYGVTAQRLGEESFERIGGAEIVEQDRRERARLNPQARRAARG